MGGSGQDTRWHHRQCRANIEDFSDFYLNQMLAHPADI